MIEPKQQYEQQYAYVLHSRPYQETSALVTFYSAQKGKFNGIVRGVRGSKSAKKAALIQPFQRLELSWKTNRRSDLVTIQQIEFAGLCFPLSGTNNVCGLYANELMYRLVFPQIESQQVFESYESLLYQLVKTQSLEASRRKLALEMALRRFEYTLLTELLDGFELSNIPEINPQKAYFFEKDSGWQFYSQGISGNCLLSLQAPLHGEKEDMLSNCLPVLKKMMRHYLGILLGNKPLNARKLLA